jgi:hypothetical protein
MPTSVDFVLDTSTDAEDTIHEVHLTVRDDGTLGIFATESRRRTKPSVRNWRRVTIMTEVPRHEVQCMVYALLNLPKVENSDDR